MPRVNWCVRILAAAFPLALVSRREGWQAVPQPLVIEARARRRGPWIAFAEGVERGHAARAGSFLFLAGGALGVVSLAFPGGAGTSAAVALATSLAAGALGIVVWLLGARFSAALYQLLGFAAVALVSLSAYFGGADGWLNGFYLFWLALFIAYFFSLAAVILQTSVITLAYALALEFNQAIRHATLVLFLTGATVAITASVVAILRRRLELALEAEREQVERLLGLDRLKDDFIATVSHELRTPVSAVYGATETLLARDLPRPLQDALLRVAHQQALRLAELVESLLTSASLKRGLLDVELESIDVVLPVLETIEAARAREPSRTIALDAPRQLPPVTADPDRLQQALAALLDNALKYAPPTEPIRIRLEATSHELRIAVADRGPGIPEAERGRVFDKFHRLDPTMRNGVGGSGLGLHIARRLIQAMQGEITIETPQDGIGTTVVVQLQQTPEKPLENAHPAR
jgi:signal transduction histidine kinase